MYHEAVVTVSETIFPSTALAMNFTHKFGEHRISVWSEAWTTTFRRWKITTWNKRVKILLLIMCTYMNNTNSIYSKTTTNKYSVKKNVFIFLFYNGDINSKYCVLQVIQPLAADGTFIFKVSIHLPIAEFVSTIDQENYFLQYVIRGPFFVQTGHLHSSWRWVRNWLPKSNSSQEGTFTESLFPCRSNKNVFCATFS